jgi:hypothetical protein
MPILQVGCSVGGVTCHGDPAVASVGFAGGTRQWFGPPAPAMNSAADVMTIYGGFVNQVSSEDLLMKAVNPGDPFTSFLWYKMNNQQNMFDADCRHGDFGYCGPQMPSDGPLLPQDQRNVICSWIAQGAPDN